MSQWQSLYMRSDLADNGEYPRKNLVQISPDLIDFGAVKAPKPADLITKEAWADYVGDGPVPDQTNYLYVRGQNLSARGVADAKVRLFCVPASLVLWPSRKDKKGWAQNPLKTAGGQTTQYVDAKAQGLFVTEPFELSAESGKDYSLVGWLETETLPNPVPDPGDIAEVAKYFRDHPDAATFQLQAVAEQPPRTTEKWSAVMDFYQGQVAREMLYSIDVIHGRAGDSFEIDSHSEGEQPVPPLKQTWEITGDRTRLDYLTSVPAQWTAQITLDYRPAAATDGVPADLKVTIAAYCIVDESDPAAEYAVSLPAHSLPETTLPQGKRAVLVGALRYPSIDPARR